MGPGTRKSAVRGVAGDPHHHGDGVVRTDVPAGGHRMTASAGDPTGTGCGIPGLCDRVSRSRWTTGPTPSTPRPPARQPRQTTTYGPPPRSRASSRWDSRSSSSTTPSVGTGETSNASTTTPAPRSTSIGRAVRAEHGAGTAEKHMQQRDSPGVTARRLDRLQSRAAQGSARPSRCRDALLLVPAEPQPASSGSSDFLPPEGRYEFWWKKQ